MNSEGVKPGVNTKGAQPGVNNEGMPPTAHSLIRGAVKASESLPTLTKKISSSRLKELKKLAYEKSWSREELYEAIKNEES